METASQLVSKFNESLESHPHGEKIIEMVQTILSSDPESVDPTIISSLVKLSNGNASILVDFWLLRGAILKEEGRDQESLKIFFEATQWIPDDVNIWLRIINMFISQEELFTASFFLSEASKRLETHNFLLEELNQINARLEMGLAIPPGFESLTSEEKNDFNDPPSSNDESVECFELPPQAVDLWDRAMECFNDGINNNDLINLQAFIHYSHSAVREGLGLDGKFKAGLERKIAQYGLFQFEKFLNQLNHLRNLVIHSDYVVTPNEAQETHDHILKFFEFMKKQRVK
ncbi:MAG: hypothetical protein ACXAC8_15455 [Candidatus Hodarchaeales archaeon]|jgi:tetratricopeptide (TPR) repeat protein